MIRRFTEDDRKEVNELLREEKWDDLPDRLGGYGLVAVTDGRIVGFCWALETHESEIAYIESFVVRQGHRGMLSLKLIQKMVVDLSAQGKTRIVGAIPRGEPYSDTLAKYYHHVGGMTVSLGYFFTGDPREMIERLIQVRRAA